MPRIAIALVALLLAACASPVPPTVGPSPAPTASPAPTSTPEPSATSAPTPSTTPASLSPAPTTTALTVDGALIDRHLDAFQRVADDNKGTRAAGTAGYDASAEYVAGVMNDLGYEVSRSPVQFNFYDETSPASLTVGQSSWSGPEWLHASLYSASGSVSGQTQFVGGTTTTGCDRSDWSGFPAGRIAVVYGGQCYTRDKVIAAQRAGAIALISLYPKWGVNQIKRPTLLDPAGITIPSVAAGVEPALVLAEANGLNVELSVAGETSHRTADNIIAELPGGADDVVMLGGHLDSVLDGPGLNDNGSGVATLLALAQALRDETAPRATVRFAFWTAEEFGDLGSAAYVDGLSVTERDRISVYLNLDMVGSPNAGLYVYDDLPTSADAALARQLLAALEVAGHPGTTTNTGGASDHAAFQDAGILTGGVFSGIDPLTPLEADQFGGIAGAPADPCYHLACDTRANVDTSTAVILGNAIAAVFEDLAY